MTDFKGESGCSLCRPGDDLVNPGDTAAWRANERLNDLLEQLLTARGVDDLVQAMRVRTLEDAAVWHEDKARWLELKGAIDPYASHAASQHRASAKHMRFMKTHRIPTLEALNGQTGR